MALRPKSVCGAPQSEGRGPSLLTYSGFPIDAIVTGTGQRRFFAPLAARITTAYILLARPVPVFTKKGSQHDIAKHRHSDCWLYS
jgi:hypothetical protein